MTTMDFNETLIYPNESIKESSLDEICNNFHVCPLR